MDFAPSSPLEFISNPQFAGRANGKQLYSCCRTFYFASFFAYANLLNCTVFLSGSADVPQRILRDIGHSMRPRRIASLLPNMLSAHTSYVTTKHASLYDNMFHMGILLHSYHTQPQWQKEERKQGKLFRCSAIQNDNAPWENGNETYSLLCHFAFIICCTSRKMDGFENDLIGYMVGITCFCI